MDLRDLQYFAVVAEHQNMGRPAEVLDLSATALSKCMRRLEKSVGVQLIQRAPKGIALTDAGTALLARMGTLQGTLNDVRHEAADLAQGRTGHIKVGVTLGAPENVMADACVSLSEKLPSVTLEVSTADRIVLRNRLRKGEIDLCITGPRHFMSVEFAREHLYDNPHVVIASAHHKLAKRKQVSIADLAGERWTSLTGSFWWAESRIFEAHGLPSPPIALKTSSHVVRLYAVAYSDFLASSSRLLLRHEARRYPLIELPVEELAWNYTLSIIYRKGAYLSPAALRLIETLKTQAKDMAGSGHFL